MVVAVKTKKRSASPGPRYGTRQGRTVVILDQQEYERLRDKADEWEPLLPEPDANGYYPIEALQVSLARKIIRQRRRLGLSQAELARRAKIRPETLNRIEHALNNPSHATLAKIELAFKAAGAGPER